MVLKDPANVSLPGKHCFNKVEYNKEFFLQALIDSVVGSAEACTDDRVRSEGQDIQLDESLDLHLPFLLPEGGYSCDTVQGVPRGFREFMELLCRKGICTLLCPPNSSEKWTVFFIKPTSSEGSTHLPDGGEPEVVTIALKKPLNSGMGVSIVAAKGVGQGNVGIYVKSIVKGGPAQIDGRLTAGDQLLSVDGQSLVGLAQERAVDIMMQTGTVVTLCVAKLGACYHGLEALLTEPPSVINMAVFGAVDDSANRPAKPNGKELIVNDSQVHIPPNNWETNSGVNRRKREQAMLKNRQLYRSNPNITEDGEQPVDQVVTGSRTSAVSTGNLCPDLYPREYLTLPASRSQDKKLVEDKQICERTFIPLHGYKSNKKLFLRQAVSQDNLCMESGGPLVDKHHDLDRQGQSHYASSPVQSSVSTNDIHSHHCTPTKFESGRRSGAVMSSTNYLPKEFNFTGS
ncbi:afadin-like [Aplochiton taeniatus]